MPPPGSAPPQKRPRKEEPARPGGLTSNKQEKVICEIDGWVLRGMQFGVLEQVLLWVLFEVLATLWRDFAS